MNPLGQHDLLLSAHPPYSKQMHWLQLSLKLVHLLVSVHLLIMVSQQCVAKDRHLLIIDASAAALTFHDLEVHVDQLVPEQMETKQKRIQQGRYTPVI